jgi:hypothetical protein
VGEHELCGANGPLWYRDWAYGDEEAMCSKVDEVLEKIGVRRMIMGHSPDFDVRLDPFFLFLCFDLTWNNSILYRDVVAK